MDTSCDVVTDDSGGGDHPLSPEDVQILEETVDLKQHLPPESTTSYQVHLLFARLYRSFFVWVGDPQAPALNSISLAIGKLMTTMENSGQKIGDQDSSDEQLVASRLSLKFNEGRPVYVAYNYSPLAVSSGGQLKLALDQAVMAFVGRCLQEPKTAKS